MKGTPSDSTVTSVQMSPANICLAISQDFKKRGITQAGAASRLGVEVKAVANQVSGKRPFSKKTAQLYASTFGYNEAFLLHGEGSLYVIKPLSGKSTQKHTKITELAIALEKVTQENKDLKMRVHSLEKQVVRLIGKIQQIKNNPQGISPRVSMKQKILYKKMVSSVFQEDI